MCAVRWTSIKRACADVVSTALIQYIAYAEMNVETNLPPIKGTIEQSAAVH